ncbi:MULTISPECIES: pantoate--beta-alanine ligase [unclassified Sporosarcina]|uniref:pantoate--beta-alanine ligase n=1 Tax=unclassified Sporosarcina TaxID=2647733 RepID=UPI0020828375|nr:MULTISPECIES: pantoate--beta-alanine ligase [unclassified Sporosarcina]GKV65704.1 pantothenate synthetase [Sporosarcina sp. NCCP-2331]GLB55717.1 pantothenate synthetase [Sporosarcina sp. NCCP-2378]
MNANATMQIVRSVAELQNILNPRQREGRTVGFVPTMGFLHEGHLALAGQARREHDVVVMSIFVNPAQFGPGEDYEAYPRDEQRDAELAAAAGVDYLFIPSVEEMYPHDSSIRILPGTQAEQLCGASRPGHFDGVLKVLLKLFNIVDPDESYFGMKDAQQLAIIETFVRDFNLRTAINRVETVREEDGLAKSSRNVRLTERERKEASAINRALASGKKSYYEGVPLSEIEKIVSSAIENHTSGTIDYVKALAYPSLDEDFSDADEVIIAAAVKFSSTRLIDNIIMSTIKDERK